MTAIQPFDFSGQQVRVVTLDGEPWFVLADLCKVLGLGTPGRVRERLDGGVSLTHTLQTAGGPQQMTIVSEAGMYEVVIRSDKPDAVTFRRWITSEVLPQIRKTGAYSVEPTAPCPCRRRDRPPGPTDHGPQGGAPADYHSAGARSIFGDLRKGSTTACTPGGEGVRASPYPCDYCLSAASRASPMWINRRPIARSISGSAGSETAFRLANAM